MQLRNQIPQRRFIQGKIGTVALAVALAAVDGAGGVIDDEDALAVAAGDETMKLVQILDVFRQTNPRNGRPVVDIGVVEAELHQHHGRQQQQDIRAKAIETLGAGIAADTAVLNLPGAWLPGVQLLLQVTPEAD